MSKKFDKAESIWKGERITPYFGVTIVTSDSRLIWCELHTFWFTV